MKRQLFALLLALGTMHALARPLAAQTGCENTSGSADIDGTPWTALCVIADTSPDCVDSLGSSYDCFQIAGTGNDQSIALFLAQPPVQGQTYSLGGTSDNGAMVIGLTGFWLTANPPYTGQAQVTTYSPGTSVIECTFAFDAQSLFMGPDVSVTNGTFVGRLLPVKQQTWSNVKGLYRE
jgi:hypothetical protein